MKCSNCGTDFNGKFCPECGTPSPHLNSYSKDHDQNNSHTTINKSEQQSVQQDNTTFEICSNCGATLFAEQIFCPICGKKIERVLDNYDSSKSDQFNAKIENIKPKYKPIIFIAFILIFIILCVGIYSIYTFKKNRKIEESIRIEESEIEESRRLAESIRIEESEIEESRRLEEAETEYITNAMSYYFLIISSVANLENISNTILDYWYDSIWEDKYDGDIDNAISSALFDMSEEISQAKADDQDIYSLYNNLKRLPDGVDDNNLHDICDAVNETYDYYTIYYDFVIFPAGSYNSFSADNSTKKSDFLRSFNLLEKYLFD
jgi:hypothetical protein